MDLKAYAAAYQRVREMADSNKWCATHGCLEDMFVHACSMEPKVIVDLGVRPTEAFSSKVFVEVAELFDGQVFSCDIADCFGVIKSDRWHFNQRDAAEFNDEFPNRSVDLLCIDTTERYDDVVNILFRWMPKTADNCMIMFRCSNLQKLLHYRDGSTTGLGWDNERGVARAIEKFFDIEIDEKVPFQRVLVKQIDMMWLVTHYPWGAGVTIARRFIV